MAAFAQEAESKTEENGVSLTEFLLEKYPL